MHKPRQLISTNHFLKKNLLKQYRQRSKLLLLPQLHFQRLPPPNSHGTRQNRRTHSLPQRLP